MSQQQQSHSIDTEALAAFRKLAFRASDADPDRGDTIFDAVDQLVGRIDRIEELAKVGSADVSRLEKMEKVVRHAFRAGRRRGGLPYGEVQAAAGVGSHNTAYNYMEEIAEKCDFARLHDPPGKDAQKLQINTSDWELEDALTHLREAAAEEDLK